MNMKNKWQEMETANVESLIRQAFNVCMETTKALDAGHLDYFLQTAKHYFAPETLGTVKPKVIVFGTDFPAEIVYALTKMPPYWVIGGNRAFHAASDEEVPRDTDPVTRAVLGQLLAMKQARDSALVIFPCASDAQRKVAYFLQQKGWNVVTVWIPAVKDEAAQRGFLSEMDHTIRTICRHVGRRYSVFALNRAVRYMNSIRSDMETFLKAAGQNETFLSGRERMAVLDTFFYSTDLEEWRQELRKLTESIPKGTKSAQPRALVIGSPIFFPNFKIPSLLSDAGVEICGTVDCRSGQYRCSLGTQVENGMESVAAYYFKHDSSSAFVQNEEWKRAVCQAVEETRPDGVIWHVLKGQIEYDFELNRCEAYLEEQDLPVIRLETDYQEQDVEQLRIRIEAFGELLTQKKKEK